MKIYFENYACIRYMVMIQYESCLSKIKRLLCSCKEIFYEQLAMIILNFICKEVKIMREGIHPEYYQAKVVCNCGNEFVTGSTKEEIHVEICSKCHPFYTGQQKASSTRGRIDKFNRKYGVQND